MPVLVSDTSIIIDLDRGELLDVAFTLDDQFVVPDLLFARELEGDLGARLQGLGLIVEPLTAGEVTQATVLRRSDQRLSLPDTFAFALAHARAWALLTGDRALRAAAEAKGIEVHGTLWVLDRLEQTAKCDPAALHAGLTKTAAHPRCRLPHNEVDQRLKRYLKG
jgi:predicted nucleic acid-binding protein